MTGQYVRLADLSDEEVYVFFKAWRLRYRIIPKVAVARSVTDTSAAARRAIWWTSCASDGERVES